MSLLRFVARTMFAGHFILDGVKAVTRPAESAPDAEAFAAKVTPLIQRAVPADMSSYVPEKAETWVRIAGVAQIAGGAMFATGIGRRLGALLLAKASVLNVAMALPGRDATREAKEAARPGVLLNVSLLGGSVLAMMDTQGQPGLAWRAENAAKVTGRKAEELGQDISKSAKAGVAKTEKKARRLARKARRQARQITKKIDAATS